MKDFERKQNKPRKGALGKTINALLRLDFLHLRPSQYLQVKRWQMCVPDGHNRQKRALLDTGREAVFLLLLQYAHLLGEAGSDTEALTVLSSEDPLPSPLSQHHVNPGIDEDSHSEWQVEGHH